MSDLVKKNERKFNLGDFVLDNIVTIIFWVFIILGLALAKSVTFNWFLTELSNRFYRNAFLVLSLIIPVIAGLGLNFGIVVGAIAGQLAIILVRYYYIGGFGGFLLRVCSGDEYAGRKPAGEPSFPPPAPPRRDGLRL